MMALFGAYALWRIVRRLVPLALAAAVAAVLLIPSRRLPAPERRVSRQLHSLVSEGQRALTRELVSMRRER